MANKTIPNKTKLRRFMQGCTRSNQGMCVTSFGKNWKKMEKKVVDYTVKTDQLW